MTTQEQFIINTIAARIEEMVKNEKVQKVMQGFKNDEDAKEWITKAAIATLFGK